MSADNHDMSRGRRVVVALDFGSAKEARELGARLDPGCCRVKVGFELFTSAGPALVEWLVGRGFDVFLDLKFHDIPNTVARACRSAAQMGVWMVNVHALGGLRMMAAAREAVEGASRRPLLTAVTILTSHEPAELAEVGLDPDVGGHVRRLALLARRAGLDGVVCSAREARMLRAALGVEAVLVTPGIRLEGGGGDDQRRVMSPAAALAEGADYLVIGRPVTRADDPLAVLERINAEIGG
jgi:orotidine-5'-phosphate decarboxylase